MTELPTKPSLLRHLTAMLYDSFLVVAIIAVVLAVALGVQVGVIGSEHHELHPLVAQALIVASLFGFFIMFWLKQGQTLGMQAWRIQLVAFDGSAPTLQQALIRCVAATVSAAVLGLGYLWRLFDKKGRYWHDYLSHTELILLPKREKDE